MRHLALGLIAFVLTLPAAPAVFAACGDRPQDAQAVAAARAAAAARCDCASARSHVRHVSCVAGVASDAVRKGQLRALCKAAVVRCAARSTCGRPGSAACCRTDARGTRTCRIKSGAASCTAPPSGSACVSDAASCCDACGAGGCAPPTTTTTLPAQPCRVDGDCNDGNPCTADRCVGGTCRHECLCVGPGGSFTCCPGPAAQCPPPEQDRWFYTCGDPVCGGHRSHDGVPPCAADQIAGASCAPAGATCDPGDFCNRLLVCAASDPTQGGACPISRRRDKQDIRYLGAEDRKRLSDELLKLPLATYRYRAPEAASRTHLGFIIDDVEPSLSVDPDRDMVDLYGYASMAVAAIQTQADEIAALRREVAELRRELRKREARRQAAAPISRSSFCRTRSGSTTGFAR